MMSNKQFPPIIVTGMFRSGSTVCWRILSSDPSYHKYYCEPLNQRMPELCNKLAYYKPYNNQEILSKWSPDFAKNIVVEENNNNPQLYNYLKTLVNDKTVLKFVRLNFKLSWFLKQFPDCFTINIIRDPRATCYSFLKHSKKLVSSPNINWDRWRAKEYFDKLKNHSKYSDYLKPLENELPYIKILALWKLNIEQSLNDLTTSDNKSITIKYEELVEKPKIVLDKIYSYLNRPLPEEVLQNATGQKTLDLGGQKKWQKPTGSRWAYEWKKVNSRVWKKGIKRAGLENLMEKLSYT